MNNNQVIVRNRLSKTWQSISYSNLCSEYVFTEADDSLSLNVFQRETMKTSYSSEN